MADRLTQLQDSVNLQAENFCNSIGILQQLAQPSTFSEFEKTCKSTPQPQEDYAQLFATMIARTAKDMDVLIESLPGEEAAPELQPEGAVQDSKPKNASGILSKPIEEYPRISEPRVLLTANNLQRLEIENNEAAVRLQEVVMRGECLLAQVQKALAEIASQQLSSKQQTTEDSSGRTNASSNSGGY